jgi:hypothetical protein
VFILVFQSLSTLPLRVLPPKGDKISNTGDCKVAPTEKHYGGVNPPLREKEKAPLSAGLELVRISHHIMGVKPQCTVAIKGGNI